MKITSGNGAVLAETFLALKHIPAWLVMLTINTSHVLIKNNQNLLTHPHSPLQQVVQADHSCLSVRGSQLTIL